MAGTKESASIKQVEAALKLLPNSEGLCILGSLPNAKGCHLWDSVTHRALFSTKKNFQMLDLLTEPKTDLKKLRTFSSKCKGFFPNSSVLNPCITSKKLVSLHFRQYLYHRKLLCKILGNFSEHKDLDKETRRLLKQMRGNK